MKFGKAGFLTFFWACMVIIHTSYAGLEQKRIPVLCNELGASEYYRFIKDKVLTQDHCQRLSQCRETEKSPGCGRVRVGFDQLRPTIATIISEINGSPLSVGEDQILERAIRQNWRNTRSLNDLLEQSAKILIAFYKERFETPFLLPLAFVKIIDELPNKPQYFDQERVISHVFTPRNIAHINTILGKNFGCFTGRQGMISGRDFRDFLLACMQELYDEDILTAGQTLCEGTISYSIEDDMRLYYEAAFEPCLRRAINQKVFIAIPASGLGEAMVQEIALFCSELWEQAFKDLCCEKFGYHSEKSDGE